MDSKKPSEKIDIIQLLLNFDLTRLCFDIFTNLDPQSLANCRLVCQSWKDFIEEKIFNLPKGRKWIKEKIALNMMDENYQPKTTEIALHEKICSFALDNDSLSTISSRGSVSMYQLVPFKKQWSVKPFNPLITLFPKMDNYQQVMMNSKRVIAAEIVAGYFQEDELVNLYIIDRSNGILLQTVEKFHFEPRTLTWYPPCANHALKMCSYENTIATFRSIGGTIKFHQILENDRVEKFHEQNAYPSLENKESLTALDHDGDKLVSFAACVDKNFFQMHWK